MINHVQQRMYNYILYFDFNEAIKNYELIHSN